MTMKEVAADIERLAKIAVGQSWGDYEIREACTVTGENFHYFLPVKYARLQKSIRAIKQVSQSEIVS